MNTEDRVLKYIVSYWNQFVILNGKLSKELPVEDFSILNNQNQNLEISLLSLFDKFKSRLEFVKQIQQSTVAIDVPKGTFEEQVFRTFLGKTSARITAKEQEALVKSYTKLLQLLNDSATKNCTAFKEGFVKDASVLKKQIEGNIFIGISHHTQSSKMRK